MGPRRAGWVVPASGMIAWMSVMSPALATPQRDLTLPTGALHDGGPSAANRTSRAQVKELQPLGVHREFDRVARAAGSVGVEPGDRQRRPPFDSRRISDAAASSASRATSSTSSATTGLASSSIWTSRSAPRSSEKLHAAAQARRSEECGVAEMLGADADCDLAAGVRGERRGRAVGRRPAAAGRRAGTASASPSRSIRPGAGSSPGEPMNVATKRLSGSS